LFADIQIYQKQIVVPTYGVDAPDPNPRFYAGRVYQGAQGRIYPYPISDVLTNELKDKEYTAVYLENEFIKICVLPELGGRIFEAVDKTNGYNFFYKQSVIKPSLIGMLGAWISGGVEWNFPHHHRANTFMLMDHLIQNNEDGSKTVWLTEIEQRHRMKMLIGLTIWPNSNLLQAELKFFNRTPFVHSFLYFANPAVHVDSTYQVIFPPEVEYVTQHAKREFAQWPVANAHYGGEDYENVDISWWKNLPEPVSFFAWDHKSDYFAGYDHGKDAGTAYVADVHLAPGKKFFTFGCGDRGKMWDKMLTDTDGPYLELMAGAYSDNQPDYSWIQPYETKTIKQYWFPIRELGGMTYANVNGALYFSKADREINLKIQTTRPHENAVITLSAFDEILWEEEVSIGPDKVFHKLVDLKTETPDTALVLSVRDKGGKELLSYQPKEKANEPMPDPVDPPKSPDTYETAEELYLTGLRLDEFHNPQIDPYPYYFEALKHDSNDVRVNTQLGILYCKRGMWKDAEKHLQRAVDRLTNNYTRPKNGEAHYYLGLALRAQHKIEKAYDAFYRAAWNFAWRAAAFYELAELDCKRNNLDKALEHINEALVVNNQNAKALNLKSVILRRMGKLDDAKTINALVSSTDPLDYWAFNEFVEIQKAYANDVAGRQLEMVLNKRLNGNEQLYLELATDYGNAGFYREAIDVLKRLHETEYPLIFYYLAYYSHMLGDEAMASFFLVQASTLAPDYCFPFRLETVDVLNYAIEHQPEDAHAYHYFGNLLFDHQPEVAIYLWEKAVSLDPALAISYRNLGVGYSQIHQDYEKATTAYENAIELNKKDARLFYELDVLYEATNVDIRKRLDLLQKHKKTVQKRDDALVRLTALQVLGGEYDAAIKTLTMHHFNVWEGGGSIHGVFVDAFQLRGLQLLNDGQLEAALADFQTATEYPDNLEVGRPSFDRRAGRHHYFLGQVYERLNQNEKAQAHYQIAADHQSRDDYSYYQALALLKLDKKNEADAIFDQLIERGAKQLERNTEIDFFAKFGEKARQQQRAAQAHYLIALGSYGKGDIDRARTELAQAQELDMNDPWINYYATVLKK
jgi:tetratricopeptide (TPR) repeat protein